jgi:hypothetical protein
VYGILLVQVTLPAEVIAVLMAEQEAAAAAAKEFMVMATQGTDRQAAGRDQ